MALVFIFYMNYGV